MIFRNPSGAPELACDACGCRWFDRMTDRCYECGEPVSAEAKSAFARVLAEWQIEIQVRHRLSEEQTDLTRQTRR